MLNWTAASDNVGVVRYNVHRGSSPGFAVSAANRIAQPTGTSYTNTTVPPGVYYYRVTAEDAAGNVGPVSNEATATVTNPPPVGLVAAYGFDEGSGTTAADASGGGNTGTLSGGVGWALGKFGTAATFDGVNDLVTVPDANALDLTTAMTLETWVLPSTTTGWRTAIFKDGTGDLVYGLYSNMNTNVPRAEAVIGGTSRNAVGTALLPTNQWSHLATTYDGANLRLYVNGLLVRTTAATGSITTSTGALRIGGNTIFSEWFAGKLDEVRVYNRALTQTELQTDMTRGAANDVTAPTVLSSSPAGGSIDIPIGVQPTARFSEPIDQATLSAFELRDSTNALVPATVSYDEMTRNRDARTFGRADLRWHVHRDDQGRNPGAQGPCGQSACS